jgi:hypothetical protein
VAAIEGKRRDAASTLGGLLDLHDVTCGVELDSKTGRKTFGWSFAHLF